MRTSAINEFLQNKQEISPAPMVGRLMKGAGAMRFRMFMLAVSSAAALAAGAPPVSAQAQGEEITSTVIPLGSATPPRDAIAKACKYVARLPFAERRNKLVKSGRFDVNNDGIEEEVEFASEGTMRFDYFRIKTADGRTIAIGQDREEPIDSDSLDLVPRGTAWLQFEGFTFRIVSLDNHAERPDSMSILMKDYSEKTVCRFINTKSWRMQPTNPTYEPICRAASEGKMSKKNVGETAPFSYDIIESMKQDILRRHTTSTYPQSVSKLDFDNDGQRELLAYIGYSNSGGWGCESNYFEVVDRGGKIPETDPKQSLLKQLQGRGLEYRGPQPVIPCGSSADFVRFENKIYLQVKKTEYRIGTSNSDIFSLGIVENGKAVTLCHTNYTIETEISELTLPQ